MYIRVCNMANVPTAVAINNFRACNMTDSNNLAVFVIVRNFY